MISWRCNIDGIGVTNWLKGDSNMANHDDFCCCDQCLEKMENDEKEIIQKKVHAETNDHLKKEQVNLKELNKKLCRLLQEARERADKSEMEKFEMKVELRNLENENKELIEENNNLIEEKSKDKED